MHQIDLNNFYEGELDTIVSLLYVEVENCYLLYVANKCNGKI